MFRLAENQQLLVEISERLAAEPVPLGDVLERDAREFTKVEISGMFDHARELQKLATFEGSPGWQVVTPFITVEGLAILVDRGVVPDSLRDPTKRPEGQKLIKLAAIVRAHDGEQGFFDPENDTENRVWYWWDVPAMLASASIPPGMKVAPFVLQALPGDDPQAFPRAAKPQAALQNNHLQYAATWFSLALVLVVIAGLFIRKQVR